MRNEVSLKLILDKIV